MEQERGMHETDGALRGLQATQRVAATEDVAEATTQDEGLGQQQWTAIHERRRAGQSLAAIARDLDGDRKTVRSAFSQTSWKPCHRRTRGSVLSGRVHWLRQRAPELNY